MWPYLANIEHEVTYEEEGKFEFESLIKPICSTCGDRLILECKGHVQDIYKGAIVACSGYRLGKIGFVKSD